MKVELHIRKTGWVEEVEEHDDEAAALAAALQHLIRHTASPQRITRGGTEIASQEDIYTYYATARTGLARSGDSADEIGVAASSRANRA